MAQFKRGDKVELKGNKHPTWYTVTSATNLRVYCKFGHNGAYAGSFTNEEVQHYNGAT